MKLCIEGQMEIKIMLFLLDVLKIKNGRTDTKFTAHNIKFTSK
jgi:hypothetical protein